MKTSNASNSYCFTVDDNIRFLEECTKQKLSSIFTHPYLGMLRRMHLKYGVKVQLNMFYSYLPNVFSLSDVPDIWRMELEENSIWLRFSFHARHNAPPFPYEDAPAEWLLSDYRLVMSELRRIAGRAATEATTTLHYAFASKDACASLRQEGVRGLIGMFYPIGGRESLSYYLTPDQAAELRRHRIWRDIETDLVFACNSLILNKMACAEIVPTLDQLQLSFYHVMTHEQYFYPDYPAYQPDFEEKIASALAYFDQRGVCSCFFEDLI